VYAPKGIGVLYVRRGVALEPLIHGAGHEAGRRAGTENTPYISALGTACELAGKSLSAGSGHVRRLRDRLLDGLRSRLQDRLVVNSDLENCLPNTLNVSFLGHIGALLLQSVPDIAASTGSACHEGGVHLSPVLRAMNVSMEVGKGAVRLSVGKFTTIEEVERTVELLAAAALKTPSV
jgi:cysteine desulfurase